MSVLLSEHLPLLASAPNGIQKLRGLILELAVRGKLVPQDPNDEPASELLKRIAKERAKLETEGKIKKAKPLPPVGEDVQPFGLPKGWEWARLGVISEKLTDGSHNPPPDAGAGLPMLSSQNVQDGWIDITSPSRYLSEQDFALEDSRTKVTHGDVLLTIVASIGRSAVVKPEHQRFALQRSVAVIQTKLAPEFLSLQLRAPVARRYYDQHGKGTAQKGIYLGKLGELPIALPPLAEQHRIVAKVDELMALCDRLEQEVGAGETAHAKLVETLLGTLTQSTDADDLAANWQRLAAHFDTLFTTDASIDALKQTVLQLAVMGKLVPQDPNDEPASELLKRIARERARLEAEGKAKKTAELPPVDITEQSFPIPVGWQWVPFGNVTICRDGERIPVSQDERNLRVKVYDYYGASGVIDKIDSYLFDKPLLLIGEDGANLVNRSTPIAFIARGKYWVNNHAHVLDGISESFLRYIELFINAIDLRPYVTGTAQPKMNQAKMNGIPIALPPEAEQHRIVAKVDELMALCDRLKSVLIESRSRQERLATTLIDTALMAA